MHCHTCCGIWKKMMPTSHDISALTHWVRDIFNKDFKVWGLWSVACEMSALRIENAYYLFSC
jgi:hypothetical protein